MRPNPADVDPENEINICPQVMHALDALPAFSSLPKMDQDAAEFFLNDYMLHILCNDCPVAHKWMLHYEKALLCGMKVPVMVGICATKGCGKSTLWKFNSRACRRAPA